MALARVALALQLIGPERYQPEQRVIIAAVHPGVVGQWGTHAATAVAAMTAVAASTKVGLAPGLDRRRVIVLVGVLELPLRGAVDAIDRGHPPGRSRRRGRSG